MATILYVEDNFQNFRLVNRMLRLEKKGYEVHQAEDGETALKVAPTLNPDLILMDINLPDITGTEVTKRLKDDPDMKATPIVALTANAMVGDRERFLAAGCDGYLRKPISREELRATLREFLPNIQNGDDVPSVSAKEQTSKSETMRESQIEIKVVKPASDKPTN